MITLLYGPPGSGKTHTVLEHMKRDAENGTRSFLIVPEQETVSAERQALLSLPPSAQLSSEVLNFSRLANRVFREYGGLCYHYIDKGAKAFLMWKTVRELAPFFESFDESTAHEASLTEWLLSAVSEMKASCVTSAMLERAVKALPKDDPLRAKTRDLALIYASYNGLVSESFDDSADDLTRLSELLSRHDFFRSTHVYIDSFTSYTAQELAVIKEIARTADEITITFACNAPHTSELHLSSVADTAARITRLLKGYETRTILLTGNHRAKSESLALFSELLWRLDLEKDRVPAFPEDSRESIRLLSSESVYEEAESIAFRILSLIRKGYRYRDIVVIARDASSLSGILDFVFDKYGIPYFLSEKEDLISLPPVKLILSALRILSSKWQLADVIAYVKTGLCDVTPADADLFEEYTSTWNISGTGFTKVTEWDMNADGFTGSKSRRGEAIREAANRVRATIVPPLLALSDALKNAKTVREECDALIAYLKSLDLESKLNRLSLEEREAGRKQSADIYARLFPLLEELLLKIAALSPEGSDEPLSEEELENAIRILLRSTEIGTIPTAVDEVTVGSAHMLRAQNVRCAILFGLCEGEFPAAVDDNGMFSSAERFRLSGLGVELSPSYDFRSADELLYINRAVSLPSELLILSTHAAGADGASARPSLPFLRAIQLLGKEHPIENDRDLAVTDRILTPRLSLEYYPALKNSEAGEALRRLYLENGWFTGTAEAAEIPISTSVERVSPELAADVFGDRMTLSQTRLEKFVKCHFDFYCSYILSLREKKQAEFGAGDSGNFLHRVLERFFRDAVGGGSGCTSFTRTEIEAIADEVIEEYKDEILPKALSMEESGRLPHLYRRLRDLSVMMIENILDEFASSDFTPRFFELKIGGSGAPSPLTFTLKDGSTLSLPGIIDRVDLCRKGNKLYVRIVDYKTGVKSFSLSDLAVGLNTQMLIYLFTLCHAKAFFKEADKETELCPAGALYHSSALSAVPLDTYPDNSPDLDVRRLAEKKFTRSGVLTNDEEVLRAMNHDLDPTYLPGVKLSRSGAVSGSSLVSHEAFLEIEREIHDVVKGVAEKMRSGVADADPLLYKGKSPCTYCEMRPICRRDNHKKAENTELPELGKE